MPRLTPQLSTDGTSGRDVLVQRIGLGNSQRAPAGEGEALAAEAHAALETLGARRIAAQAQAQLRARPQTVWQQQLRLRAPFRAETPQLRQSRLLLCDLTARVIQRGLDLLGIRTIERM